MQYDAITFDTQTIEHNSFYFDGGLLAQLKQFKNGPIKVIVSEIVVRELQKHLTEKTRSAKDGLLAARRKAADYGFTMGPDSDPADIEVRDLARTRLYRFFNDIGVELVKVDEVQVRELVGLYFSFAPPFSGSGKKKNEFPDAIALLSLDLWAKSKSQRILAVSGDKDWSSFASANPRIDVVEDLAEALSLLQRHAEEAIVLVQKMLSSIANGDDEKTSQRFEDLLSDEVASHSISADADSIYEIEAEQVYLSLNSYEFVGFEDQFDFDLVQSGARKIVARIVIDANVDAEANFSMSIYDSIDKDFTSVGSVTATTTDTLQISVLVTFELTTAEGEQFQISKMEIVESPKSINFGNVEPDYGPDYDDEEYELPEEGGKDAAADVEIPF